LVFSLHKNGQVVQEGHSKNMIFPVEELIASVSQYMTLKVGDVLFTGTPAGVGRVQSGDVLTGTLCGRSMFEVQIR